MKIKKFTIEDLGLVNPTEEQKAACATILSIVNKTLEDVNYMSQDEVDAQVKAALDKVGEQNKETIEGLTENIKKLGETIEKMKQKGMTPEFVSKFDEKINAMLDSEKFKAFANGEGRKSGTFDGFSLKDVSLTNNYTGDYLLTQQQNRLENPYANKPLHTRDIITTLEGDNEHTELAFTQVDSMDRNARFVTENGMLSESLVSFKEVRTSVKRVGTYMRISKRMLKSRAYVRSFILTQLPEAVAMAEDWQMLFGDGTGENLLGIANHTGVVSVESLISTAFANVAAGEVDKVESYNGGADTLVTFKKEFPGVVDGMTIKFTGAAVDTALNTAHVLAKVSDACFIIKGAAYTGAETAIATMTAVITMAGFKSVDSPNGEDVIKAAFAAMTYAQYSPNAIYLNPMDVFAMETEKDTTGRALNYIQMVGGRKTVAGRLIVEYNGIPAGAYLLGDFNRGAALVDYSALELEFADDVDSKLKNQVVLIAQEEVIFPVYNPWSFAYGSLAALKTAITK